MADRKNIVTLGIGASPGKLLWFFTSGLESGVAPVVTTLFPDNAVFVLREDRRALVEYRDKRAIVKGTE